MSGELEGERALSGEVVTAPKVDGIPTPEYIEEGEKLTLKKTSLPNHLSLASREEDEARGQLELFKRVRDTLPTLSFARLSVLYTRMKKHELPETLGNHQKRVTKVKENLLNAIKQKAHSKAKEYKLNKLLKQGNRPPSK